MATIRECDRCGGQTSHAGGDNPKRWTALLVNDDLGQRPVELCEGCGKEFRKFLIPIPRMAR